jgi:hypothetical protein
MMKTPIRFIGTLAALLFALSWFTYTSASVDDRSTGSTDSAQLATPVLHSTPVWHPTVVAHPTVVHRGHQIGACVRSDADDHAFVFKLIDENEIEVHRAHGDIIGVNSPADCPNAQNHVSSSPSNNTDNQLSSGESRSMPGNILLPLTGDPTMVNTAIITVVVMMLGLLCLGLNYWLRQRE